MVVLFYFKEKAEREFQAPFYRSLDSRFPLPAGNNLRLWKKEGGADTNMKKMSQKDPHIILILKNFRLRCLNSKT